ncbi:MAG: hypothetical protein ACLVL2_01735 [Bacteroides cellulosilyticus]
MTVICNFTPVFLPQGDGVSFHLTPVFLDTVPGDSPRLKNWTDLPVGTSHWPCSG